MRRPFPPPIGWLPLALAGIVVLVLSGIELTPQFKTRVISAGSAGTTAAAGENSAQPGRAAARGGPAQVATRGGGGSLACAAGRNGGATDVGVSAREIHVASTIVTSGIGAGFLGEAVQGMLAAIDETNNTGGVCGRAIKLDYVNDGWSATAGQQDIGNYINSGNVFALVGEPDSEGLDAAVRSGAIDAAGIPVVGTDGMLQSQYNDPWVWPVAASTVTNMHTAVQYAYQKGARSFGIVFDTHYKFGREGAYAFDQEVKRLTKHDIPGFDPQLSGCAQQFCGVSADASSYTSEINTFSCKPCDMVMMLLEPKPMTTWMKGEESNTNAWYRGGGLYGGEPLFDDNLGHTCANDCAGMVVWTGYHAAIQPFDSEHAVYTYKQSLQRRCPTCDAHNEFTEGAYLGTRLFIEAARRAGPNLTRSALRHALDGATLDLGLSTPLHYGSALPHLANIYMAGFADNSQGSFNGWNYLETGFLRDPAAGQDFLRS